MQVFPALELRPFIKHFILLKCADTRAQHFRFFADGSLSMVLTFRDSALKLVQASGDFEGLPAGFLYGHSKQYKDLQVEKGAELVIVVFQAAGVKQLFKIAPQEIQDSFLDIQDLFGGSLDELYEKITQTEAIAQKIAELNAFFCAFLAGKSITFHPILQFSLQYLAQNKDGLSVTGLSKKSGYSERQLERIFQEYVGLGPKSYLNIMRFHHFLSLLRSQSNQSNLTELSYAAGYFDQSHLIKEFRNKVGVKPSAYLHAPQKLTANFIGI
jgi:AraC-like DNA-binding protein